MNTRYFGLIAGCAAIGWMSGNAQAAPLDTCPAAGGPTIYCGDQTNPIYLSGSTALEPLYLSIGKQLITDATNPATVVYLKGGTEGSCSGVGRLANNEHLTSGNGAVWVDKTGKSCACTIGTSADHNATADVTIGVADVYPQTCDASYTDNFLATKNLKNFNGPVNAMTFVAPKQSSADAISAEQAFLLFGFGMMYNIVPWIGDPMTYLWIRPQYSGTLRMLASYIGVDPTKWQGARQHGTTPADNGSGDVFNTLNTATTNLDNYIGILGFDYLLAKLADPNTNVKVLAFRGAGQRYAYYPDSTPTATDKRNLRDGHYLPWGPAHLVATVDGTGTPTNPIAKRLIAFMQSENDDSSMGYDSRPTIDAIIAAHLIPNCAMKVTRPVDGANLSLFTPAQACDCYFEKKVGVSDLDASCSPPNANQDCNSTNNVCASGTCRRGLCESR